MTDAKAQRKETPKAADAFAAYVALGPSRSYRALATEFVKQKRYKTETTAFNAIATWAGEYRWQDRIATARSAEADRKLQEAADLDADTYLRTSHEINRRADWGIGGMRMDELVRMRESVRKPQPKGGVSVSVNVEIQQIAEKLAKDLGIDASELIAEAERIAAGAWGDA